MPAEVLAAFGAKTVRPGMARKPGVFKSRHSRFAAAVRFRECYNLKADTIRVRECEFILAFETKPIALVRDPVIAGCAKPVTFGGT